ncbi:MAG TPA: MFS transporter [Candidatus Eisenbacteria bacterium]
MFGNVIGEYWTQVRGAGRNARLFLYGVFLVGLGQSIFMLLFNLYLRSAGLSDSAIGQVLSKTSLGAAVAAIPVAFLFRAFAARLVLTIAGAATALLLLLQGTLTAPELLLPAAFCAGMVLTTFRLSIAPVVMRETREEDRPFLFSASFAVLFLAAIAGSALGGFLPHLFGFLTPDERLALRWSLWVGCGVTLLSALPFYAMKEAPSSEPPPPGPWGQLVELMELDWALLLRLCLPTALIGLGAGLIIPFMNLYFRDRFALSAGEIGILFMLLQAFMILGNLFGPAVSRAVGLVRGVVLTQLASVPFMLLLALSGSFPIVLLAFLARGALMNMNQPLTSHFAMEVVPRKAHAVTNSLLSLAWFLAWSVSADIGGAMIGRRGYTEPLLLAAGLYVAASVLYYAFFRRVEESRVPLAEVEIPEA